MCDLKGLAAREAQTEPPKPAPRRQPWQKLLALFAGLVVLLAGIAVISLSPKDQAASIAGVFTGFSLAVTGMVTAYIGGNVAEHGIYQKIVGALGKKADETAKK